MKTQNVINLYEKYCFENLKSIAFIKMVDYFVIDNNQIFIMELGSRPNVKEHSFAFKLQYSIQDAVLESNKKNILMVDIKIANIVEIDCVLKFIDYGKYDIIGNLDDFDHVIKPIKEQEFNYIIHGYQSLLKEDNMFNQH